MKLFYFAWVREKIGKSEETVELPNSVNTIEELINWLESRGPEFKAAFQNKDTINAALNQAHVPHQTELKGATEVAFFPPVTGG